MHNFICPEASPGLGVLTVSSLPGVEEAMPEKKAVELGSQSCQLCRKEPEFESQLQGDFEEAIGLLCASVST